MKCKYTDSLIKISRLLTLKYINSNLNNIDYNYCELEDFTYFETQVKNSKLFTSKLKNIDLNFRDFEGSEFSNLQILDIVLNLGIDIKE